MTSQMSADYNLSITGRHLHVTEAMKKHAIDKFTKVEKFSSKIIDVMITMDIQKNDHLVDIVIKFGHMKIKVHATSPDMYASIDKAVHKLEERLRRYKGKLQKHQERSLSVSEMNVQIYEQANGYLDEVNEEIEEENQKQIEKEYRPPSVVSLEKRPLKILTKEEAIMKLDLSGDFFLIFRNEEDQKLKIIYRREDENFGIIEAE